MIPPVIEVLPPQVLCERCHKGAAQSMHTCPYQEEINGDSDTLCDCCEDCEAECCDSI